MRNLKLLSSGVFFLSSTLASANPVATVQCFAICVSLDLDHQHVRTVGEASTELFPAGRRTDAWKALWRDCERRVVHAGSDASTALLVKSVYRAASARENYRRDLSDRHSSVAGESDFTYRASSFRKGKFGSLKVKDYREALLSGSATYRSESRAVDESESASHQDVEVWMDPARATDPEICVPGSNEPDDLIPTYHGKLPAQG